MQSVCFFKFAGDIFGIIELKGFAQDMKNPKQQ